MKSKRLILCLLVVLASHLIFTMEAKAQVYILDKKLNVALLGDYFSAGNGAKDYADIDGCYRSPNNWASNFVKYLRQQGVAVNYNNEACSGAATKNCFILR